MKNMRRQERTFLRLFFTLAFILLGLVLTSYAQQECPADKVCISPAAARKAITDDATVKAQAVQIDALKQAVQDEKGVSNDLKIKFAEVSGRNDELRQAQVSDRAIIEILLKNSKKKCQPLSILCL